MYIEVLCECGMMLYADDVSGDSETITVPPCPNCCPEPEEDE
jgi:hypothetical protein